MGGGSLLTLSTAVIRIPAWQREGPELQEGCAGCQNYTCWRKALGMIAVL